MKKYLKTLMIVLLGSFVAISFSNNNDIKASEFETVIESINENKATEENDLVDKDTNSENSVKQNNEKTEETETEETETEEAGKVEKETEQEKEKDNTPNPKNYSKNSFVKLNNKLYYVDKNGELFKDGWLKNEGKWYYFKNSVAVQKNWINYKSAYYYLNDDGVMLSDSWIKVDKSWYYLNSNGDRRQNGWEKINKSWFYFKEGVASQDKWIKYENEWYYFDSNCYMRTGWFKDYNNKWYYSNKTGKMLSDTFVEGYYLGLSGAMFEGSNSKTLNVSTLSQLQPYHLPMGCEGTSLTMALHYRGINNYNQKDINSRFELTGDPRTGFIGTPFSFALVQGTTPTIWPSALIKYTIDIYPNLVDLTGCDLGTLMEEIDNGNPVVFWFTYGNGRMKNVSTPNGDIRNSTSMHCVLLVGYDENRLYYNDPYYNKTMSMGKKYFYSNFVRYGRMAVSVR